MLFMFSGAIVCSCGILIILKKYSLMNEYSKKVDIELEIEDIKASI
jgi:hypothetical protein